MYEKCIDCSAIGVTCNGPNFGVMSSQDVLAWCKLRKKHLGWTQEKLAEKSGMPKGTISSLFAGKQMDFRHDTVKPMIKALIGGDFGDNPCHEFSSEAETERKALEKENKELLRKLEDKKTDTKFLQKQIQGKNIAIVTLSILLFFAVGVIFAALIVDRLNSDIGFFWLEDAAAFFNSHTSNGLYNQITEWRL